MNSATRKFAILWSEHISDLVSNQGLPVTFVKIGTVKVILNIRQNVRCKSVFGNSQRR